LYYAGIKVIVQLCKIKYVRHRTQPMSLLRRIVAIVVLLGAVYVIQLTRSTDMGLGSVVWFIVAVVVAFMALVTAVFNLPFSRDRPHPDSGFENSVLGEKGGMIFGAVVVGLFALALSFLALRGIWTGAVETPWSESQIEFSKAPFHFLLGLTFWSFGAAALFWLSWKVFVHRNSVSTSKRKQSDV
jgi:cobalamin synthase